MPLVLTAELRHGFLARLSARYGVAREEITLTAGVSEALAVACAGLIEPGDRVLVEIPTYRSLAAVPAAFGGRLERLERGLDGGLEAEAAARRVSEVAALAHAAGGRLAAVLVSDLHNPSGARLSGDALEALAGACRSAGAKLVIDEVYRDADEGRPVGTVRARHPEAVSLGSLTKVYGLGGLRCGWILAPAGLTETFTRVQNYFSVIPAAPSVFLGMRALDHAEDILRWSRTRVEENRAVFRDLLRERPGGFLCPPDVSRGTVAFPYRPLGPATDAEVVVWARDFEVEVVPGRFFEAASGIRIGLGAEPREFRAALERWAEAALATAGSQPRGDASP